jgi:riboflavin biosynthesis pyrimidine reductase
LACCASAAIVSSSSFLRQAGVVDELFLTLSPLLLATAGAERFQLVEGARILPHDPRLRLASARRYDQHLFLRYLLRGSSAA